MYYRAILLLTCIGLAFTGCSGPQPLPVAPTPIPTLIPATLPAAPTAPLPTSAAVATTAPTSPSDAVATVAPSPTSAPPTTAAPAATSSEAVDPAVALGKQIFENNCRACHRLTDEALVGPGLGGLFERRPQLPSGEPFSEENVISWIKTGGGGMPGFFTLSDEELNAVVSYLKEATATK